MDPIRDFPFSDPECPKCKADTETLKMLYCTGRARAIPSPSPSCSDVAEGYEHLHSSCGRCGYAWLMKTADADEKESSSVEEEPRTIARGRKRSGKEVSFEVGP